MNTRSYMYGQKLFEYDNIWALQLNIEKFPICIKNN